MNRICALILVISFSALPAFREESARNPLPVRLGTEEGRTALSERAGAYLNQTRRLLGARFQEEFYRAAIETRLSSFSNVPESTAPAERSCFDFLTVENDPCAAEVFAFLDGIGEESLSLPDDVFYSAGNPINACALRLVLSPPPTCGVPRRGLCALPLSLRAGLALSLITLLASIFSPAPPIGGAAGIGISALRDYLLSSARLLCVLPVFSARAGILPGVLKCRTRSRAPEEKKSVCLLR
ncbi:MAG: hypothetical protein IK105_08495 [Thermoguttaceae bacterium]|nr:hypothetical protein [Thermoguttaceae bacterium]